MDGRLYISSCIFCFLLGVVIATGLLLDLYAEKYKAMQQCEAELPRHLTCDYKIVAFVKEENN